MASSVVIEHLRRRAIVSQLFSRVRNVWHRCFHSGASATASAATATAGVQPTAAGGETSMLHHEPKTEWRKILRQYPHFTPDLIPLGIMVVAGITLGGMMSYEHLRNDPTVYVSKKRREAVLQPEDIQDIESDLKRANSPQLSGSQFKP